jgi:predicted Zn-dependent protease
LGRGIAESGQQNDIKDGQDAIREMKTQGLMPKEIENREVTDYVAGIARRLATHSDLRVPVKVTVLDSKEINAFALPGGFLFVERGLLEAVDDESELAGVVAHEMSHVIARHGHKLMLRATIASIFFQAAQVAAMVFTGGAAGIGTYYALQYGFYGLGFVLDLNLLGVSRDFELEADQLGIQYAWSNGYDPTGFVRFFDKMATTKGYVEGASWFYDHPPFYERMVEAERETTFLPKKEQLAFQTSQFEQMKKALAKVTAKAKVQEDNKPSLFGDEKSCPAPKKLDYEAGQSIDAICGQDKSK